MPNAPGVVEDGRDLVRDVAAGSADALARLYDRHGRLVYALARRMLTREEDAEEVVQDVFAQVWREAARYRADRASVAGWLVMMTRARAIDRLRARRVRPDSAPAVVEPPDLPDGRADPEDVLLLADDATRVSRALAVLPAEQRSLIDLAYFEGFTQSEIAVRTGAPLGTVKTRMRAALQTLRTALSPGRGDEVVS